MTMHNRLYIGTPPVNLAVRRHAPDTAWPRSRRSGSIQIEGEDVLALHQRWGHRAREQEARRVHRMAGAHVPECIEDALVGEHAVGQHQIAHGGVGGGHGAGVSFWFCAQYVLRCHQIPPRDLAMELSKARSTCTAWRRRMRRA